jgi:hypothetical protein
VPTIDYAMDVRKPPQKAGPDDRQPETASRRRRLMQAAAVTGELTAALIADSQALISRSNDLIARPHMTIRGADGPPAARPRIVCEECGLSIDTPGVAIVRGRNVTHVRCA